MNDADRDACGDVGDGGADDAEDVMCVGSLRSPECGVRWAQTVHASNESREPKPEPLQPAPEAHTQ
jgi:hypothetical protein